MAENVVGIHSYVSRQQRRRDGDERAALLNECETLKVRLHSSVRAARYANKVHTVREIGYIAALVFLVSILIVQIGG